MTTYGYKAWVSGNTLNAEDAMKYLMRQVVTIWETQAAREADTAYTDGLIEGNLCFIQYDNTFYYYDGEFWKAIASQTYVDNTSATTRDALILSYMESN
jgi:hypothetical protein